jgi:DNA-binding XRE family transcriptional regulator
MPLRSSGHDGNDAQRTSDVLTVVERLAPNLRKLRRAAKMTQEGLAEAAGIDASYVQRIERGVPVNATVAVVARWRGRSAPTSARCCGHRGPRCGRQDALRSAERDRRIHGPDVARLQKRADSSHSSPTSAKFLNPVVDLFVEKIHRSGFTG